MKRGVFSEGLEKLTKAAEREFELFQYKTLSKSRKKIFEACSRIAFYSCIYEYFLYAEEISEKHIRVCLNCGEIIASLYQIYLKYEYLQYSRWEDIEEILDVLAREQEHGTVSERRS